MRLFAAIVEFVVTTLRPPGGASTTTIRTAGAVTAALGLALDERHEDANPVTIDQRHRLGGKESFVG